VRKAGGQTATSDKMLWNVEEIGWRSERVELYAGRLFFDEFDDLWR
jgi:hypothetical protein